MAKIDDFEFRGQSQEVIDFKDKVREVINFGKYQPQVLSVNSSSLGAPSYVGRRGEMVFVMDNDTTGRLYVNAVDNTNTWSLVIEYVQ